MTGIGCLAYDDTGTCIDNGDVGYVNPTSLACTGVGGSCLENGNSCAGGGGYGGSGQPVYSASNPNSSSIWTAINTALKSSSGILGTRYAVPQLNPGQLIQTGPGGTSLQYQLPVGATSMGLPSMSSLSSSMGGMLPILLIGGVVLFLVVKK